MKNIYEVQNANKIKSFLVVVAFLAFTATSVYILVNALAVYMGYRPGGLGFLGIALIISGVSTFFSYYFSDRIVLGISGAKKASKKEYFEYFTVTENLCLAAGLPMPDLYVIPDTATNAFATGRNPDNGVVCVTTGLLDKLSRTELEGVIAHELTHIRNYDILLMSIVSVMVGSLALLADWLIRINWYGGHRDNDEKGSGAAIFMVLGIVFALLSPIIAQLIHLAISRRREFTADAGAVMLTRQPSGLISALKKISSDNEALEVANKATAHLYIVSPFKSHMHTAVSKFANLFNTHPPVASRIKALEQMV